MLPKEGLWKLSLTLYSLLLMSKLKLNSTTFLPKCVCLQGLATSPLLASLPWLKPCLLFNVTATLPCWSLLPVSFVLFPFYNRLPLSLLKAFWRFHFSFETNPTSQPLHRSLWPGHTGCCSSSSFCPDAFAPELLQDTLKPATISAEKVFLWSDSSSCPSHCREELLLTLKTSARSHTYHRAWALRSCCFLSVQSQLRGQKKPIQDHPTYHHILPIWE